MDEIVQIIIKHRFCWVFVVPLAIYIRDNSSTCFNIIFTIAIGDI